MTDASPQGYEILIPPRQNVFVGILCMAFGLAILAMAAWIGTPQAEEGNIPGVLLRTSPFAIIGFLMVSIGVLLKAPKGMVSLNTNRRKVMIGGDIHNADLSIALDEIVRIVRFQRVEEWKEGTIRLFSLELQHLSGGFIAIGESQQEDVIHRLGQNMARMTKLPYVDELSEDEGLNPSPAHQLPSVISRDQLPQGVTQFAYRVGFGGFFHWSLFLAGLSMAVVGALLFANLKSSFIAGLFFGPFLFCIGAILVAYLLVKLLSVEKVHHTPSESGVQHMLELGPFTLTRSALTDIQRVRITSRGIQGYSLEIISAAKTMALATGVNPRSHLRPIHLLSLMQIMAQLQAD